MNFRIGTGYDVHRLTEGRKLILGGVDIPYEKGLLGHSDADVLIHAVIDALLGAAALGDIGKLFPDNDMSFKDIDSRVLLRKVYNLLCENGFSVNNVDATLQAFLNAVFVTLTGSRMPLLIISTYFSSYASKPILAAPSLTVLMITSAFKPALIAILYNGASNAFNII